MKQLILILLILVLGACGKKSTSNNSGEFLITFLSTDALITGSHYSYHTINPMGASAMAIKIRVTQGLGVLDASIIHSAIDVDGCLAARGIYLDTAQLYDNQVGVSSGLMVIADSTILSPVTYQDLVNCRVRVSFQIKRS